MYRRYASTLGWIAFFFATTSCSGRYSVGFEPMTDAAAGAGGSSGSAGSGGEGGTGGTGGGGGPVDAAPPPRCGFMPDPGTSSGSTASSRSVLSRIYQFLDDTSVVPPGNLPPQPSQAWAADQAMAILDGHVAAGTEARGLVRFLTTWLAFPLADAGPTAAHTWSTKLLDPNATLTTLLAAPTGEPHRIGILTDKQLLTGARSTITRRGLWMVEKLLCGSVPPSPPNIPILPPMSGVTRREKLESQVGGPNCAPCHVIMDPPGDSLEHFDEMGSYRDLDNGKAVDSSGTIDSLMLGFTSYDDLAPKLATSCTVAQCFSKFLMADAYGTAATSMPLPFTEEELNHVANAFADSDFSVRALVKAIVQTPSFLR